MFQLLKRSARDDEMQRKAVKLYIGDNKHIAVDTRDDCCVKGITVVDDKIYVVHFWKENSQQSLQFVYVYNMENLQSPSYYIPLPGAKSALQSIIGCSHKKCLYIAECNRTCLHKIDLNNYRVSFIELNKYQVEYKICGISVTSPEHNILLILKKFRGNDRHSLLVECNTLGDLLREIPFDSTIRYVKYGVKILDKIFICHGDNNQSQCKQRKDMECEDPKCLHRIVRLNLNGDVEVSYGGHSGKGGDQLNWPRHFTIDNASKLIFLGDNYNNRILLLNFDLKCLGQIKVPDDFREPTRVCFDSATKRLFVGEYCNTPSGTNGKLSVISFENKIVEQ